MDKIKFNRLLQKIHKSRNALAKIYNYLFPLIVIYINYSFHGKLDGKDVAQQFFIKLMEMEIKDFIVYPTAWAYKISNHIAIDILRKSKNRTAAEKQSAVEEEVNDSNNFFEILDYLNDEKHRKIIYLYYFEKYKLIEISKIINVNYSTVKFMHKKALKILKNKLPKE